jgi:pseudouridine synthase
MKLLTYLQQYHHFPRRQCTTRIQQWYIKCNHIQVENFTTQVVNGDDIDIVGILDHHLVKINDIKSEIVPRYKPKWYIVSKDKTQGQTIYDILPSQYHDWYYIGRLDKDSHGLLLLTNDPATVHNYEHPSHRIKKIYRVQINHAIDNKTCDILKKPNKVVAENQKWYDMLSCDQVHYDCIDQKHILTITLLEGKKRHIRRLLEYIWLRVLDLCRIECGSYKLKDIKPDLFLSPII